MAVPEQTPYIEHTGNGVTTSFSLGFQCESKDHLIVLVDEIEPPIATWSLTGGNVIFATAPAAGQKITLQRNTSFGRTTNYQSFNNSFRPQTVNIDFDRIWWKLQELGVADWLMKLYVDRLHQQQEEKINNLKTYVDDKDDELRAYLLEEIRKQGVALDQLDDYYNYLMQRLAQIAVDKGWAASFVVDVSGKNQQEINDIVGLPWREKPVGYNLYDRVMLENGEIVVNMTANNTGNPNSSMTGWRFLDRMIAPERYGAIGNGDADDSAALTKMFSSISPGSVVFGTGVYKCSNVEITKNVVLEGGTYKAVMRTEISGCYHIPSLISSGGFDYIVGRNVKFTGEFVSGGCAAVTDNRIGQLFKFTDIRVVYFDNLGLSNHASNWNTELDLYGHCAAVIDNCKFVRVKDLLIDNIRIEGFMVSNFDVYEIDGFRQINSDAIWTPLHSYSYTGSRLIAKNIWPKASAGSTTNLKADSVYFERCRYLGGAGMDLGSEGDPSDVTYAELKDVEFHNCAFTIYTPEINGSGMKKLILDNVRNTNVGRGIRVIKCREVIVNKSSLDVVKQPSDAESVCYNFQIDDFEEIRVSDSSLTGGYNCMVIPQRTGQHAFSKKLIQLNNCKVDVNIAADATTNGKVIKLSNTNTAEADVVSVKKLSINGGSFSIANGNITGAYVGGGFSYIPPVESVEIFGKCVISYKTMTDARDWILTNLKNFSITDGVKFLNNGRQTNFLHGVTESLILEDIDIINNTVAPPSRFFFSQAMGCRKLRINEVGCYGALNSAESVIMFNNSASYRAGIHYNGNNYGVTTNLAVNDVVASVSYNPPSLASNEVNETTVSIPGVPAGQPIAVGFSSIVAGIELTGVLSSAGTAMVRFKNISAAPIDLTNGVIIVKTV